MDELSKVFESVADYFGLLAEPARLRILHALCEVELPVSEIVDKSGLTQANTSRHLNMLYRAGIVDRRREGSQVFYRIVDPNFKDMCRTVCVTIAARADMNQPQRASFERLEKELNGKAV
ncbi:ArsR/SmtB family transcription factor [Pseudazoarcus pumilus]|uniref:Transcriptional regulator n=1 Tax=Pseudazoarcus pumilus TaxID=2067960 RepID=A0A2I6S865_9RHOO|nr:metalloregulator ArsR/SmtB family transcription factor [Pseudazoarcus pumilus]AUN95459.1 transcriptional regulator [Pseudazoarcus pumilus]